MKSFSGKLLFLDRSDINTDEIIPAKYLTEGSKAALKPYCLEDLELPGFDARRDVPFKAGIVSRGNFGCGSSREHAPWALEANGIHIVIAESFARIFRQNMFNGGLMAVTLPGKTIAGIFSRFAGKDTNLATGKDSLTFSSGEDSMTVPYFVDDFDGELVKAGGWVDYADAKY